MRIVVRCYPVWVGCLIALGTVVGSSLPSLADDFGQPGISGAPTDVPDEPTECNQCPWPPPASSSKNASTQNSTTTQQAAGGDPVDAYTGRMFFEVEDLVVPGVVPIRVVRQYNSQSRYDSPVGYGWNLAVDARLFEYADSAGEVVAVTVRSWEGRRYRYTMTGTGAQVLGNRDPERGGVPRLEFLGQPDAEGVEYVMAYQSGERALFDVEGRLHALVTPQGNRLRFFYSAQKEPLSGMSPYSISPDQALTVGYFWQLKRIREQLLHQIPEPLGQPETDLNFTEREVTLEYDPTSGRLTQVTSHDGRRVQYSHDEAGADHFPTTLAGAACGGALPCERGNLARVVGAHPAGSPGEGVVEVYRYPETPAATSDPTKEDFEHLHDLTHYTLGEGMEARIAAYDPETDRVTSQDYGASHWLYEYELDLSGQGIVGNTTRIQRTIVTAGAPNQTATTLYTFDAAGFLTRKQDAEGHVLAWTRNAEGNADQARVFESTADEPASPSRVIDFTYHLTGNLETQSTTLAGTGETVTTSQGFEGTAGYFLDEVTTSSDAAPGDAFTTRWSYFLDGEGFPENVEKIEQGNATEGFVETAFTYHADHNQLETITPPALTGDDLKVRRLYHPAGTKEGLLSELQLIEDDGSTVTVLPNLGRSFDYDAAGNLSQITDALGHVTELEWDARGRLIRRTEQIGGFPNSANWESTLFRYGAPNAPGLAGENDDVPGLYLLQVEVGALGATGTGAEGRVQRFVRDARGRIVEVQRKLDGVFETFAVHAYDSDENRTQTRQPTEGAAERTLRFSYDKMRQLETITDDASNVTVFAYDAMGNRTKVTDARAIETDFVYDELDRLVQVVQQGEGLATGFAYDAAGNVTLVTDPKGQRTQYDYDALSRLTEVTQELGIQTDEMTDPHDYAVRYAYDARSRLTKVTNARATSEELVYGYFAWGGLETLLYDADQDGQADPGERVVSYSYDTNGNLLTTSDAGSLLWTLTYDALNRVDTATAEYVAGATKPLLDSDYNAFGDRSRLTLTDATGTRVQEWAYDDAGRLDVVCMPQDQQMPAVPCEPGAASETLVYDYLANDDLKGITHGNGLLSALTYLPEGPLDTIAVTGASELHKLDYAVDPVLNVDTVREWVDGIELERAGGATPAFDFDYDDVYRLTQAAYPDAFGLPASEPFGYDAAGNRDDDPGAASPWRYDANNRIEASPGGAVDATYVSDDDGNVTSRTLGTVTRTFTWDATNRLRQVVDAPAGANASYAYDPFGRRIEKTSGGVTTYFLWDGDDLLAEYEGSGARQVRYAYAGGFAPAEVAYVAGGGGEDVYSVHTDHLDTPRMLTDSVGTPVWRSAHAAFGAAQPDEDPDGDTTDVVFHIRFPGQYYDAETESGGPGTGLHQNRFRYYDPTLGRYISADPIGQDGGVNLFLYGLNDPVNDLDLFGLSNFGGPITAPPPATPYEKCMDDCMALALANALNPVPGVSIGSNGGVSPDPDPGDVAGTGADAVQYTYRLRPSDQADLDRYDDLLGRPSASSRNPKTNAKWASRAAGLRKSAKYARWAGWVGAAITAADFFLAASNCDDECSRSSACTGASPQ